MKKRVLFYDESTKLQTVTDLETKPRGGMVSSLFLVSDYLSCHGCEVTVFSDIETTGVTTAGTRWTNRSEDYDAGNFDVLVCNRGTGSGHPGIKAKHRILWTHDLPHVGFIPNPKTIKAFACTVFMSRYAEGIWRTMYPDIGKSVYIPNGVDKNLFYPRKKDFHRIIFCSHPNRGLKRLPFIFDAVKSRIKTPIRLTAYSRLNSAMYPHDGAMADHTDEFWFGHINPDTEGFEQLDPIPQAQLAEEIGKSGLMILPTAYPEICSNTVLQALASGVPIVTTGRLGSACEWIKDGDNGILTKYHPQDYVTYLVEIIRGAVKILENRKYHEKLSRNAAKTKIFTWEEIGSQWLRLITKLK
jgi:glycosyltransferase involved in cell wall biosynthesis